MLTAISIIFVLSYLAIALEHPLKISKSASALMGAGWLWTIYALVSGDINQVDADLNRSLMGTAQIVFFLMGAMTIVEVVDAHEGFMAITSRIKTKRLSSLMWLVGFVTFFLSSILDNLTTTIVMISLMKKLLDKRDDRIFFAGIIVIAANAGGAWTPIGDVTTTMLWIGGQISPWRIMGRMLLPCLASLVVALLLIGSGMRGDVERPEQEDEGHPSPVPRRQQMLVLVAGMLILVLVPVFKTVTHLPPCMGLLAGLALLWILTERLHGDEPTSHRKLYSVTGALHRIDASVILFFLGILLAVSALQTVGVLNLTGGWLRTHLASEQAITLLIGICSAVIDNVPLVAAAQGMYAQQYPMDAPFWDFLAYCAGTGGSLLIIGSAAGVAAMGMEKLTFGWYLRRVGWIALLAYLAGAGVFVLQASLLAR